MLKVSLIIQRTEQSNASLDPVRLWLIAWNFKREHKVCRVARSRKQASTLERLVARAVVNTFLWLCTVHLGLQEEWRHLGEELFVV